MTALTPDLRPAQLIATATDSDNVSLTIKRDLTLVETIAVGRAIGQQHDKTLWWVGDWARYVKTRHGQHYDMIVEATGLAYQTVKNAAVVSGEFDPSYRRRYLSLSWSHFAEVARVDDPAEQERWLALAMEEGLSRQRLRDMLSAELTGEPPPVAALERLVSLPLRFTEDRIGRWQQAAARDGADVREWIADVLDAAAAERLAA